MDKLNEYRRIIEETLTGYANLPYRHKDVHVKTAFDRDRDRYLVMKEGWNDDDRVHYSLIDIEIIGDKIWIHCDHTEEGVASDFERDGIPKDQIVLGFREPEVRPYTGYAAA